MAEGKKRLFLLLALCLVGGMFINVRFNGPTSVSSSSTTSVRQQSHVARVLENEDDTTTSPSSLLTSSTTPCPASRVVYVERKEAEHEIGNHPQSHSTGGEVEVVREAAVKGGGKLQDIDDAVDMLDDANAGVTTPEGSGSGVRTFSDMCLYPDTDRLVFYPKDKAVEKAAAWLRKRKEQKQGKGGAGAEDDTIISRSIKVHQFSSSLAPAYVVRDVCALGHFPKDLAHYQSWVTMEAQRHGKQLHHQNRGGGGATEGGGDEFEEGLISLVILGHRCASKNPNKITNKRTPVFRDVLRGWVDAITRHSVLAEADEPSSNLLHLGEKTEEEEDTPGNRRRQRRRFFLFYADVVNLLEGATPTVMCFPTMHEREESWRWFPNSQVADSFRQRLWAPLGLDVEYDAMQQELRKKHFDFHRKLQVLVLRRDEDRHFNEAAAAKFLEEKFGKVARIVFTQFDKPPAKHLSADTNITVAAYDEQIKALFQTDVLVAAHGAALSSVVYMRPGTVVIELFPHNFRYYMYEELSRVLSLRYVGWEGAVVSPPKCCTGRSLELKEVGTGGGENRNAKDGGKYFTVERDEKGVMKTAGELLSGRLSGEKKEKSGDRGELEVMGGKASVKSIKEFNGLRECKKCDIYVTQPDWYYLVKNALSSLWLQNSRLSNVHHFDIRR